MHGNVHTWGSLMRVVSFGHVYVIVCVLERCGLRKGELGMVG